MVRDSGCLWGYEIALLPDFGPRLACFVRDSNIYASLRLAWSLLA